MRAAGVLCASLAIALTGVAQDQSPREVVLPTPARVTTASIAAVANRLVAACEDHKLRVWDFGSSRLLQTIPLGKDPVDFIALSPDGRWVFIGDHFGRMNVWNAETGVPKIQLRLSHYPSTAVFSSDGKLFALAPMGDPVQVFDVVAARKLFETPAVIGGVAALAFSRDGTLLATADADTSVRIYDARSGKMRAENHDFILEPLAVSFTSDGKQVIAGGGDKLVVFLDAATGKRKRATEMLPEPVAYLETSHDGKSIAGVLMKADNMTQPAPVVLWDASSGAKLREWLPQSLPLGGGLGPAGEIVVVSATRDAVHVRIVP